MFEIHVTISCPDLVAAAKILRGLATESKSEPVVPAPAPVQQNAALAAPTAPAAATVPLAQAPTFTLPQICKAGAELVGRNPGMLPQLNALLAQYGVQAVTDLKPEHFGAVATALRGMGAQI